MVKVYLSFVLVFVCAFSIFAQNYSQNTGRINSVNAYSNNAGDNLENKTEAKTETTTPANDVVVVDRTEELEFQKTNWSVLDDSPSAIAEKIVKIATAKTLGAYTTGNAVIDGYILDSSLRHDIDPRLIFAQMSQESSFRKGATSNKGASGLMQLMPATAARFGVKNIYNPKQNIEAGVRYMRWLLDEFSGDVKLALAAYNAGEGSVKKYGNKVPPYSETQKYVERITTHYEKIKM